MFQPAQHPDLPKILDAVGASVAVFSSSPGPDWQLLTANDVFGEGFMLPSRPLARQSLAEMFSAAMARAVAGAFDRSRADRSQLAIELPYEVGGLTHWWRLVVTPIAPSAGEADCVVLTAIDISSRKDLELALDASHQRFEALIDTAYDAVITIDADQRIKMMNLAARQLFLVGDDLIGESLDRLIPMRFRAQHAAHVEGFHHSPVRSRPMLTRAPVVGLRSDGVEIPLEVTISKIRLGETREMTAVVRDLSDQVRLVEELRVSAITDCLTGIANRRRIDEIAQAEFARSQRFDHDMSLLLVDIDFFKAINDSHGHEAGDAVLKSVTERIRAARREADSIGRWGGEEFLVVLPEAASESALACAERIREAVAFAEHAIDAHTTLHVTISVGVASRAGPGDTLRDLFARADAALYQAKGGGRNRVARSP